MSQMIFLSHNHKDKPLVEAVALRLAAIFGQSDIFYDSWSIRPGDGIIDRMNDGLSAPQFVFFFVSANSLSSDMVKLEWQNALYLATQGKTRLVPVRVDGSDMPALLKQTFFIDMHTIGLEAAIAQIIGTSQGNASFTPQHQGFSNLTYAAANFADGTIEITVSASHMMEPNPRFAFPTLNNEEEVAWWIKGHGAVERLFRNKAFDLENGEVANAMIMRPVLGSLTPTHPLIFEFRRLGAKPVELIDVLHDHGQSGWVKVPPKSR